MQDKIPPKAPEMRVEINGLVMSESEYEEYKKLNWFQQFIFKPKKVIK